MKKIAVTGGSGKAGAATLAELARHGYQTLNIDTIPPSGETAQHPFKEADLRELGEVYELLGDCQAVVHLAAIPNEMRTTPPRVFENNTLSTYNIFQAAKTLRLQRVVWASSETVLGLPFHQTPPRYAPVDDRHAPYPNYSYSLSKVLSEEMAAHYARWSGIAYVGLRFSNIMLPEDYERFPSFWKDPALRSWNLWGYVDARDVGQSCRLALEADLHGAPNFTIAAADTVMDQTSASLMRNTFHDTELRKELDTYETLLSIEHAKEQLGYSPRYSWRDAQPPVLPSE